MSEPERRSPGATHTFLFADLAGYTALTEAHGDEHAADAAAEFFEHVRSLLPDCGGEEVKAIGDALMVRIADADAAALLARGIICGFGARHRALGVRIGMHTGTAVQRGDDWFGATVNLASRVADFAGAGEVLLTQATSEALRGEADVRARGRRTFKNVSEPVALYELALGDERPGRALPTDPVCRMSIDPALAEGQEVYRGVEYHFCSTRCHGAFVREPRRYTRQRAVREQALVSDEAREQTAKRLRRRYRRRPAAVIFYHWMTGPIRRRWRARSSESRL